MAKKKKTPTLRDMDKAAKRKAHFAAGGTVAMWRGRAVRDLDASSSKHRANKRACRGRVRYAD